MGLFSKNDGATPARKLPPEDRAKVERTQARHKQQMAARRDRQREAAKTVKAREDDIKKNPPGWF